MSSDQLSNNQSQTKDTFSYKWGLTETYESDAVSKKAQDWLIERYCGGNYANAAQWFKEGQRSKILDAGCGSGFSGALLFQDYLNHHDYLGVDISDAVEVAKKRFAKLGYQGNFLQHDIQNLPFEKKSFDIIFSEGVMHHTDSTEKTLLSLASLLKDDGLFLFYVYRKKSVIREFTDDFIREKLAPMNNEEAWEALYPLTKLGIELGKFEDQEIEIKEDIPLLDIKKGKMSLQRFFYWHVCKMYYSKNYNVDEMNHLNFDWFRPLNCHRHTEEEIRDYCRKANLKIEHIDIQEAGFTVRARAIKA